MKNMMKEIARGNKATKQQSNKATKRSTSAPKSLVPDDSQKQLIVDWLKLKDKQFFLEQMPMRIALPQSPFLVSNAELTSLVKEHCRFWGKWKIRPYSIKTELTWDEWDRVAAIARREARLLNEADSTFAFCLQCLLGYRLPLNPKLLMDCSAFHRLTGKRFRI